MEQYFAEWESGYPKNRCQNRLPHKKQASQKADYPKKQATPQKTGYPKNRLPQKNRLPKTNRLPQKNRLPNKQANQKIVYQENRC